jgi:hypothetical protein
MKSKRADQSQLSMVVRVLVLFVITSVACGALAIDALMQGSDGSQVTTAGTVKASLFVDDKNEQNAIESAPQAGPEAVTAVTYPFTNTSAIALEDMSSGTTQLVAAGQDDTASAVTNIGFDYWYDGVRMTQFSANANGLLRFGSTAVSTGFTNSLASTTDAPKIGAYWDDQCTGTNGKVHFKVIGSAPNRKLVVEWQNMQITRGAGCAGTGNGTYQLWLFETTGVVEFVYGSIQAANAVDGGYSVGLQSGVATNFASVTTTGPTVSYVTANNAQTNAITAGTAYLFTPNVPVAPTAQPFTGTTAVSTTLNWTDNSGNEVGFAIYRSTDGGTTYNFLTQTAANSTSFTDNTVLPSTNYFYKVFAVTEGALSAAATNSLTTPAAGNITSTAAGGPWSSAATWVGGVVPTSSDNVTIADGATVSIDTAAVAFTVTVGAGGAASVLEFEATTARTLNVGNNVTIASNGTLRSNTTGTQTGHVLTVANDLINNGVLDFSTSANTAGTTLTFTGATNNTFSGTGGTTDLRTLTINKGTSSTSTLEVTTTNFTIQGGTVDAASAAFLTLTNGTLKISGTFTANFRTFTAAAYTIGATAGFWLNNPNYTVAGQNASPTNNGLLRVSQGTFNAGSSTGNAMGGGAGASFVIEGGTTNFSGRFNSASAVNYTQTGGTVNACTVGNAGSLTASFGLTSTTSSFTMSGGAINLVQINSNATVANRLDYQVSSTANVTGGTLNVGTAATAGNAGNFDFRIRGNVPALVIDNTTNAKNVLLVAQTNSLGNTTINVGTTLNAQANIWLIIGDSVTNNGTITVPTSGGRFYFLGNNAQTYTGSGSCVIVTAAGSVDLTMDNPLGLTINPGSNGIITQRVNFFRGGITNSNKLTLGNGGVTVGVLQYGLAGGLNTAGNFDQSPIFNIGTGGQTILYAQEPTPRTTSFEIPPSRSITNTTINNTNGVVIGGGDLTVTGTATFTVGNVTTNANTLIIGSAGTLTRTSGHVIGNLRKTFNAAGSKTYEVGTANGFSPVTVNATAGTFPANFDVRATQGPDPAVNPATSVQRFWTLNGSGITADLTFQYLAGDVNGTEANYKVIREIGGTSVAFPTSTVNTGTHTGTLTGVSSFSNWTVGEITSPTAAPATISGIVTRSDGSPLGGVTINLGGNQTRRTITDGSGKYSFANVDTDGFYTVAPNLANYSFSPGSRSFALIGNRSDAVFTGAASTERENPSNGVDYFVRQQYLDFLNREPDMLGWLFWTDQINRCGDDANCVRQRRIDVSAAFFSSEEFQQSGSYIDRLYSAGLGRPITYEEFKNDHAQVAGGPDLETQKATFADAFVARAEFLDKYQQYTADTTFVDALLFNIKVDTNLDLSNGRDALIAAYNGGSDLKQSRSAVLQAIANNADYRSATFNRGFVRMEYFGYLRRNVDQSGFDFWVEVLNNRDAGNYRGMVCSFLTSAEYQLRFSSIVTHSNSECGGQ